MLKHLLLLHQLLLSHSLSQSTSYSCIHRRQAIMQICLRLQRRNVASKCKLIDIACTSNYPKPSNRKTPLPLGAQLRNVSVRDTGVYECQVGTTPAIGIPVHLAVVREYLTHTHTHTNASGGQTEITTTGFISAIPQSLRPQSPRLVCRTNYDDSGRPGRLHQCRVDHQSDVHCAQSAGAAELRAVDARPPGECSSSATSVVVVACSSYNVNANADAAAPFVTTPTSYSGDRLEVQHRNWGR